MPYEEPLELFTESRGAGPSMVWAHGFAGSGRNFRPQARAFESAYNVLVFDARGHARSPAPDEPSAYEWSHLLSDLERLVSRVGPGPVVLGGLSMGARTALEVALRVGPKVGALVLSSLPGPRARRLPWAQAFAQALEAEGLEVAGERYVWGEASRLDADGRALVRRGFLEHKAFALKHLLRRALSELRDLEEFSVELGRLEVPTLVVAGSRDEEAVSQGALLASMLPQAEVQVIEGAGHVANLERSAEFNGIVGSFLERAA